MPHRRFQLSEAIEILTKVGNNIPNLASFTVPDGWHGKRIGIKDPEPRWVTALFVQFRFMQANNGYDQDGILAHYRTMLQEAVADHNGDLVALSKDAGLAMFTGPGQPQQLIWNAVEAAASFLENAGAANCRRVAQNLSPLRLGIGLDGGHLPKSECNRHPRLEPGLQEYWHRARHLSELNYQAPFPALFISQAIADWLTENYGLTVQSLGSVSLDNQVDPLAVYAVLGK